MTLRLLRRFITASAPPLILVSAALLACGAAVDLGGNGDAGAADSGAAPPKGEDGGAALHCGSLDAPSVPSTCRACDADASDCQPNGCYGGYWCDSAKSDCSQPPKTCQ